MEELSMKVKVRFAQPTILVKQEAYEAEQAEFERLFQENKDLRVSEAHLRNDHACAKAQIEAHRQAILHRDEQMLNQFEEIKALERMAIENEKRKDEITELRDENCNLLLKLESAEKVIDSLETQLTRTELHNTLLESRLEETTAELVKHELNHYKDEAEEWKMTADKLSEAYRELLSKFTELQTEFNELNEDYDELAKAKREYAEEIDRLRHENKGLRNQMPLPEFMRQFIEMTREAVRNEFPDSDNS
jgi:chromosome segregation ATPase